MIEIGYPVPVHSLINLLSSKCRVVRSQGFFKIRKF